MQLNLYSVSDKYIEYLRKFDDRVYDNKQEIRVHTKKYLGIVLNINSFNYYIPFSSPKNTDYYDMDKKQIRKSIVPIIRIAEKNNNKHKLYGTLRISNMIPVPITEITPYFVQDEKDVNYKNLILSELRFIRKNTKMIIRNANVLYKQKENEEDIAYVKNTLNFKLLEQKCLEYIRDKI